MIFERNELKNAGDILVVDDNPENLAFLKKLHELVQSYQFELLIQLTT